MPSGVYQRSNVIPGSFKKGNVPHNKGIQKASVKKKVELLREGKAIECKKHGWHFEWRLHSGNNVQCKKCIKEWQQKAREDQPIKFLIKDAKQHAKKKKIEFNLTENDLIKVLLKQNNRCALSNISFEKEKPSLDRINPNKGYVSGNVQLVTINVNIMKSNLEQNLFIDLCHKVALSKAGKSRKKKGKK